jgi:transcription factor E
MAKKVGSGKMPNGRKLSHSAKKAVAKPHAKANSHRMSERQKRARAEERKILRLKAQKKELREKQKLAAQAAENERLRVEGLLDNAVFADFISKNVGKKAINVIKMLNTPLTDEKIAADLEVKINEVRRILNVLDSYGVARYDTNKDSKGWLTFKWYLDVEKLEELHQSAITSKPENSFKMPENCNDFFYCGKCYEDAKVILPFDAAYEAQFKCDGCGKALKQLNKEEARMLFEEKSGVEAGAVAPA